MKKYIGFAMPNNGNHNSVQVSKIQTKEAATAWVKNHVAKNMNMIGYVCEVFSTVTRPDPQVMVLPFMPEAEPEPETPAMKALQASA